MKEIVKFFDDLPLILKLIFALPVIDGFAYGIYRIAKGHLLLGIVWVFIGAAIGWVVDIISIILHKKITYFC